MRRADNLTTFMCRLSRNLGASNSWNPQGLFRPVMGLLYLTAAAADCLSTVNTVESNKMKSDWTPSDSQRTST
jgi:hypothetical protein